MNVFRPRVSKKIIIILVTILVAITVVNAQDQYCYPIIPDSVQEQIYRKGLLKNEEYFQNADYILEVRGIWDSFEPDYYGSKIDNLTADDIYKIRPVKVLRVYKGEGVQSGDTVVAFLKGGMFIRRYTEIDPDNPATELFREEMIGSYYDSIGDPGIYIDRYFTTIIFGYKTEYPKSLDQSKNDHYLKIKIQNKARAGIFFGNGKIFGLDGLNFPSVFELYEYMRQFEDMNVPQMFKTNILTPEEFNKKNEELRKTFEENKKKP
ncbi:MAG: hypothetical protein LBV69_06300 [Bacteroidales bacterium]|jgi:hypothetical protein|nr:hypothetical protein [Bacteroidales bacterium]